MEPNKLAEAFKIARAEVGILMFKLVRTSLTELQLVPKDRNLSETDSSCAEVRIQDLAASVAPFNESGPDHAVK